MKNEIETILGVDAKQFKQISMIAQGEFLKLLYADSTERGNIFRRVFHTDLYAAFQKRLKDAEREKRIALEDSEKQLVRHFSEMTGKPWKRKRFFLTGRSCFPCRKNACRKWSGAYRKQTKP